MALDLLQRGANSSQGKKAMRYSDFKPAVALSAAALLAGLLVLAGNVPPGDPATRSVIVQGTDLDSLSHLVQGTGGEITHELGIINAVAANLTERQIEALRAQDGVRVSGNATVESAAKSVGASSGSMPDNHFPTQVGADRLWAEGVTGLGVGVALIDTGARTTTSALQKDTLGVNRLSALYDATSNQTFDLTGRLARDTPDDIYGHGTHVAGIILGSEQTDAGTYNGVAPDANLLTVRALGDDGNGTYADVIRGLGWVVDNRLAHNIRVVNLSLSAEARSHYWDDPLNQAVMRAWEAGIVVVTSAGNKGPDAMTIGVPGNVPYVVTVGAMTDNYTPGNATDDRLTSFSSAGPTVEGFVKPELVAPGGHIVSNMSNSQTLAEIFPEHRVGSKYFEMSGTSQSTAVVSGVVALMLQHSPWLTPDDVKCRLMSAANPAVDDAGNLAYSVFQQGAGFVDAYGAVHSTASGCANQGLDVSQDLSGAAHFGGMANQDADGNYYIMGLDGYMWSDSLSEVVSIHGWVTAD